MSVEIPEFKKCCCCLPLRPGLIGWAYFKIIANAIIVVMLAYFILTSLVLSMYVGNQSYIPLVLLYVGVILIIFFLFLTDFVATIVFVVAGHKKNASVIRGYFIYNIGVLIVTVLLIVAAFGIVVLIWVSNEAATMYLILFVAYVLTLVLQVYYTLLVRSAAIELQSSGEVRFVNNSDEAQYMMTNKEKTAEVETV